MDTSSTLCRADYDKAKKIGINKLVRQNIKLYNTLCVKCRLKTARITRRRKIKLNDYCLECRKKAEKILGGL